MSINASVLLVQMTVTDAQGTIEINHAIIYISHQFLLEMAKNNLFGLYGLYL